MKDRDRDNMISVLLQQNSALHTQINLMRVNKHYLVNLVGELREENRKLKAKKWYWPFN